MKVLATALDGVLVLEPRVFGDARGYFLESWNARTFLEVTGVQAGFVQDNHSRSGRGVLRGLHYQLHQPQGKLVRVVRGRVFDVAVDLRVGSPTFGGWVGVELSEDNQRQLWVPPGFAHGFVVLSELADFLYKTTDYHAPEHERSLAWNDPLVGVSWPLDDLPAAPILSAKDRTGLALVDVREELAAVGGCYHFCVNAAGPFRQDCDN